MPGGIGTEKENPRSERSPAPIKLHKIRKYLVIKENSEQNKDYSACFGENFRESCKRFEVFEERCKNSGKNNNRALPQRE